MRFPVFVLLILISSSLPSRGFDTNSLTSRKQIAVLQISLDREGFSSGVIDGRLGKQSLSALKLFEGSNRTVELCTNAWTEWKVPADYDADITPIPNDWVSKSQLSQLGYETLVEKTAEKFHISEDFLKVLNPRITNWTNLVEGTKLRVPNLKPKKLPFADHLKVSLSEKNIIAYDENDKPIAIFPCSIAAKKEKRPVGQLQVKVIAPDPDYLFDPALFKESPDAAAIKTKLMISPGPNNPVGSMWIGLSLKGYGIHGTPWPEAIGKTESHGCFRLTNWDAQRLGSIVKIGINVVVEE